jgi:N-acetyl-1-D-myo-inositol-2-amino-2-deoxy-alpha-D-glucopyranoside deacetylase
MEHSLMAIYAHPDDEAFGTGGTISRYASEGVKVYLVSATRGEVGEISDPSLATPETLGCVREDELRCAAETMGVTQLVFLDYRDSGMAGTSENQDPRAFVNAQAEEVVRLLVRLIRNLRPEVIVTFEPNGGYGHPDHIAIHKHTVAAFQAAADPTYDPKLGAPWQAKRLFYTAIPHSFFEDMRQQMTDLGLDTQDLVDLDDPNLRWPDEAINVRLDVSHSVELKWQALQCHRTQFGPGNLFRRLPEERVKKLMSKEYFALAWPEPGSGLQLPDLFAGV